MSHPSKVKFFFAACVASWIVITCCAITLSTSTSILHHLHQGKHKTTDILRIKYLLNSDFTQLPKSYSTLSDSENPFWQQSMLTVKAWAPNWTMQNNQKSFSTHKDNLHWKNLPRPSSRRCKTFKEFSWIRDRRLSSIWPRASKFKVQVYIGSRA